MLYWPLNVGEINRIKAGLISMTMNIYTNKKESPLIYELFVICTVYTEL